MWASRYIFRIRNLNPTETMQKHLVLSTLYGFNLGNRTILMKNVVGTKSGKIKMQKGQKKIQQNQFLKNMQQEVRKLSTQVDTHVDWGEGGNRGP